MNAGVPAGSTDSGTFLVQYDQFFADPNTCSFCWVGDSTLTVDFSVPAAAPAPEPGTVWVGAGALGLGALVQRWRLRCASREEASEHAHRGLSAPHPPAILPTHSAPLASGCAAA